MNDNFDLHIYMQVKNFYSLTLRKSVKPSRFG